MRIWFCLNRIANAFRSPPLFVLFFYQWWNRHCWREGWAAKRGGPVFGRFSSFPLPPESSCWRQRWCTVKAVLCPVIPPRYKLPVAWICWLFLVRVAELMLLLPPPLLPFSCSASSSWFPFPCYSAVSASWGFISMTCWTEFSEAMFGELVWILAEYACLMVVFEWIFDWLVWQNSSLVVACWLLLKFRLLCLVLLGWSWWLLVSC